MFLEIFSIIAPVLLCAGIGLAWAKRGIPFETAFVTRLVTSVGFPCLIFAALVKADLIDRLAWFRSPKLIGGDGRSAIAAFGIDGIAEAPAFARDSIFDAGDDVLETYHRAT